MSSLNGTKIIKKKTKKENQEQDKTRKGYFFALRLTLGSGDKLVAFQILFVQIWTRFHGDHIAQGQGCRHKAMENKAKHQSPVKRDLTSSNPKGFVH